MAAEAGDSWHERQWPATEIEAASLRPAIASLLESIPLMWEEFDRDKLTELQSRALFLLISAGMVERRGWIRSTIANHSTVFEFRFQATGEGGYAQAMERAIAIEFETWSDAWREWTSGPTAATSPFHVMELRPHEWRLTGHGKLAREELNEAQSEFDRSAVLDFVLKRGLFGPGHWVRRCMGFGQPLTADDYQMLKAELDARRDPSRLPRRPVAGSGQLLELRKVEQPSNSQPVNLTNWSEGATAFAEAFARSMAPMFEAMAAKAADPPDYEQSPIAQPDTSAAAPPYPPEPFSGGEMVFLPDRVTLCGVEICGGRRSESRRAVLELLAAKRPDGSFVAYSGGELESRAKEKGATGSSSGWIRDLRASISERLRNGANIEAGPTDVILSGGSGYRLSQNISVQFGGPGIPAATSATAREGHDPNDPDQPLGRDPDDPDQVDDPNDPGAKRRAWFLEQLAEGKRPNAGSIADHFACSKETAKRDVQTLKERGMIEFVGTTRTGYYRRSGGHQPD